MYHPLPEKYAFLALDGAGDDFINVKTQQPGVNAPLMIRCSTDGLFLPMRLFSN